MMPNLLIFYAIVLFLSHTIHLKRYQMDEKWKNYGRNILCFLHSNQLSLFL